MTRYSGQITVSGVTNFPDVTCQVALIKAHPDNTGVIYVGNDGSNSVSETTGYPIAAGEALTIVLEGNLEELYAFPSVDYDVAAWLLLDK